MKTFGKVLITPFAFLVGIIFSIIVALVFIVIAPVMGWLLCESLWYDDFGNKYWRTTKDDIIEGSESLKDTEL